MTSSRLRHLALVLTLLSWLAGITGGHVHALEVAHVRCADHGELMEWSGHGQTAGETTWISAPDAPAGHDHGCSLAQALDQGTPVIAPAAALLAAIATAQAPTGPPLAPPGHPLAYAPKTSPPTS